MNGIVWILKEIHCQILTNINIYIFLCLKISDHTKVVLTANLVFMECQCHEKLNFLNRSIGA